MVRRILVVEDEPDICGTVRDLLEMIPDTKVDTAPNYTQGRAAALAGDFDAVLTDERLGDGRGVDILAEVAKTRPVTLLVLMSAFQDFDTMMRGVNAAHIDHFFQKPIDPEAVLAWFEKALADPASGKANAAGARPRPFRRIGERTAETVTFKGDALRRT